LVEAHNPEGQMLGFGRLTEIVGSVSTEGPALIRTLLDELGEFTGPGWRQEDDVTLVTLSRSSERIDMTDERNTEPAPGTLRERELERFLVPSAPGNEVLAIEKVTATVGDLGLPRSRLEQLRTAVGEAVMNGMEHGNRFREDLPVEVLVSRTAGKLIVRVFDAGTEVPSISPEVPDLEAKLEGRESPRGWGLFLMRAMVDDVRVIPSHSGKTTELILNLEGDYDDSAGI
jgi:anti-sigma regulatory factor (Ser/Thr protein kinase)